MGVNNMRVAIIDTRISENSTNSDILYANKSILLNNSHGSNIAKIVEHEAPDAELLSIPVLCQNKKGTLDKLINALYRCMELNVDIVNMSLGFVDKTYKGYNELSSVCIEARKRNIILVSAYKNSEQASCISYPAGYMETIGVGYDKTMKKNICIYSNNIFFPTNCVFIPNKEKIELGTGSSFLTACVTGIIANHKKRNYECIMKYFKNELGPGTLLNKSQLDLHTILKGKRYCYIGNKKNETDVLQEKFYSRLTSGNIINFESNYFMNEIDKADIVILGVEPKWTGNNEIFQMVTYFASQGKDIIMPFPYINASERYKIASAYKVRIISLYV